MSPAAPSERELRTLQGLRRVVATLRGPGGCPWDRVQTPESLRPYLLEETAEAVAALDEGDDVKLAEELGDLLFEILIHVQLAEERGAFRMTDVVHGIASKLVRRHPHVFADGVAETPDAVIAQWDELKSQERVGQSALTGIPSSLPALAHAQALQRRAARAGFGWESDDQAWRALDAKIEELRAASDAAASRAEAGDAVFALANILRRLDVDAEDALRQTSNEFAARFRVVETLAGEREVDLKQTDMEDRLALWEEAKARRFDSAS